MVKIIKNNKNLGFTLIELLVTMAIVGVLVTIAFPMFNDAMVNNRLYSEASQTNNIINLARAEAIRRNDFVSICPTNDGATCLNGNNLQTGTIVYVNSGLSGLSTGNQIIKVFDKWTQLDRGVIASSNLITFSADGRTNLTNSILVCKPGYNSFSIDIHASGKLQMTANNGDGGC